jgi:hypothetical protein
MTFYCRGLPYSFQLKKSKWMTSITNKNIPTELWWLNLESQVFLEYDLLESQAPAFINYSVFACHIFSTERNQMTIQLWPSQVQTLNIWWSCSC